MCNNAVDLVGNELSSDILEVSVFYDDSNGALRAVGYATPIFYYSEGELVGKYFIVKIERTGTNKYAIQGTSLIGIMEKEKFYGGMYSGSTFRDVFEEIAFCDGLSPKYDMYLAQNTGAAKGAKIANLSGTDAYKYHMFVGFTVVSPNWASSSTTSYSQYVAGSYNMYYWVQLNVYRASSSSPAYWTAVIRYGMNNTYNVGSQSEPLFGDWSTFYINISPLEGIITAQVDYYQYNDSSINATRNYSWDITVPTYSNAPGGFNYAYGSPNHASSMDTYEYRFSILWRAYNVWNASSVKVIEAVFAKRQTDNKYFVVNGVDGTITQTTYFQEWGSKIGTMSDFKNYNRFAEIGSTIEYNQGIASLPIYGWIPAGTRRDALHHLMFSQNVCLIKSGVGNLIFTGLANSTAGTISNNDLFENGREEKLDVAKRVMVTEHGFSTSGATSQTIFDNSNGTAPTGNYIVLFDNAPISGTPTASGLTIHYYNCNAAIVSGSGTITGVPYIHSQNIIQYENTSVLDGTDVSVSNIGLITSVNSGNVLEKMKSYYCGQLYKITNAFTYRGQKCGLKYSFRNPFNESVIAFFTKYSARTSTFVKTQSEFIRGYVSSGTGGYTGHVVKTYSEEWDVPSSVRAQANPKLRFNIIGKGSDGTSGTAGASGGAAPSPGSQSQGGAGGSAGVGGSGGKIYSVEIDATNAYKVQVSQSGVNTIVKVLNSGGNQIASYSSNSGVANNNGFTDIFTGIIYARKGPDGQNGAAGGKGGTASQQNNLVNCIIGDSGANCGSYVGGQTFSNRQGSVVGYSNGDPNFPYDCIWWTTFGGGGGASAVANGGNSFITQEGSSTGSAKTQGGAGASGGTPAVVYPEYGSGGSGGNGGGGGGGGGMQVYATKLYGQTTWFWQSQGQYAGVGGAAGSGTSGKNGCVIIYY